MNKVTKTIMLVMIVLTIFGGTTIASVSAACTPQCYMYGVYDGVFDDWGMCCSQHPVTCGYDPNWCTWNYT